MKTYVHLWLVFTTDVDSFLCELQTQAKETYFINDTGCVFCDILAEAKETVEHQISLIVNLKYQQLEHTSQPTLSQWRSMVNADKIHINLEVCYSFSGNYS